MKGNRKKRKYNKQSKKVILGILLVVGLLCGMALYGTKNLKGKDHKYAVREAELESQIAAESKKAEELSEEEIYVQTKQFIEEVAKKKLGLVKPGEILVKPNSEE